MTVLATAACFSPSPQAGLPCGPGDACPAGQHCAGNVCVADGDDPPDAPPDLPSDASPIDAPPDAFMADAPPDAVTVTFGESGTATYADVTRDASLTEGDTFNDSTDGHTSVERNVNAAMYRFDVSAIPSSATVISATLEVATIGDGMVLSVGSARVYRLTETWDEATVNFFERMPGVPWSAVGADPPSRDPISLVSIPATSEGRFSAPLPAAVVQGWVTDAGANAGLIIDTSPNAVGHLHFGSKEGVPADAALLSVTFLP